jgi:hypothetical protein
MEIIQTSIKMVRYYGCNLPIEIWHQDDLSRYDYKIYRHFSGVSLRDIKKHYSADMNIMDDVRSMKSLILLSTKYDEVLFLDSNVYPIRNINSLFESQAYRRTGTIFWKGFAKGKEDSQIFELLQLTCFSEFEIDSSQILVRKSAPGVFMALSLALYMQQNPNIYNQLLNGEKEVYNFAWRALRVPYHLVEPNPSLVGRFNFGKFCGTGVVQYMPFWPEEYGQAPAGHIQDKEPQIVFVHANLLRGHRELQLVNDFNHRI